MTTRNKEFFDKFRRGEAVVEPKTETDFHALLGMCEAKDLRWRSGDRALGWVPPFRENMRVYHKNSVLTFGNWRDSTDDCLEELQFTEGEFTSKALEVREMTIEEIEEALGYRIKIVVTH